MGISVPRRSEKRLSDAIGATFRGKNLPLSAIENLKNTPKGVFLFFEKIEVRDSKPPRYGLSAIVESLGENQ